jgi:hypothetical protein
MTTFDEFGKWEDIGALPSIERLEVKKGLYEAKVKKKAIEKLKPQPSQK